ncbi:MAG TPA: metal-dependent hydrolase [Bacteroidia bacterium]|nr:metal-dependent hydrolase [Bacteroidota bacterium]HQW22256.1 metal-dependent hydrolase [Bacteroidia bacterium]
MASAFTHAFAAFAIGKSTLKKYSTKIAVLGMICAIFPDVDVLSFHYGIPYGSFWGHRGFIHSILFALLFSLIITSLFFRSEKTFSKTWFTLLTFFFIATVSHGVLDALTNGGLGVAFFSPFDNTRYFFPWHPVQVSPVNVHSFFSEWGIRVLKSEIVYIWIPSILLMMASLLIRKSGK